MKRALVILPTIAAVFAGGILFASGCGSDKAPEAARTTPAGAGQAAPAGASPAGQKKLPVVRVAAAARAPISAILEMTGSAEPYRLAQLASPAEGPVRRLRAREGDRVAGGDTLLVIGRTQGIDALIASLREELRKEEDNLRRTRQLVESGALAGEELDQASASHERVRAQLVKAQETGRDYSVTAPWPGVVSRVMVREGDFASPRAPLLEMYDPATIVIRAAVPERSAARVREEMHVEIALDAYPGEPFVGRVSRVYPYLDESTRSRTIEIAPLEPVALLPGMFARLRLRLETVADAVVVPAEAVATGAGGEAVAFVVREGKALRRAVRTGLEEGGLVEILAGIEAGEDVVVAGQEKLKDGAEVRVAGGAAGGEAPAKGGAR